MANTVDLDQTPYDVVSDLALHCLPFYGFPGKNGLKFRFTRMRNIYFKVTAHLKA